MKTEYSKNKSTNSDLQESLNIEKCLSTFDVLSNNSRGKKVTYAKDDKIYTLNEDGVEVCVGSLPPKVSIGKTSYKLNGD